AKPGASCKAEDEGRSDDPQRHEPSTAEDNDCGYGCAPYQQLFSTECHPMTHEAGDSCEYSGVVGETLRRLKFHVAHCELTKRGQRGNGCHSQQRGVTQACALVIDHEIGCEESHGKQYEL